MSRDGEVATTMRIVALLFLFGTIAGSNDTLYNEIPTTESADDLEEKVNEHGFAKNKTLHEIFNDAVHAYLEEDWDRCINDFNAVSHGYNVYKRRMINCRQKCRASAAGTAPIFPENIEDLHFYEKKVKETLCLLMCNQEYREIAGSKALKMLPRDTEHKLMDLVPYEYVHICYYQKERYQDAANAIFTYLVRHPEHEASTATLKNYLTLPGVEPENVVNLEGAPYVSMYLRAVSAYENENYAEAASLFEASLRSYLDSEEECRFYCEGPFDQGWLPEFTSSIANHFAHCLKCKRSCSTLLNNVNGNYQKDILWTHYDYLQFSYYKLGNLKAACANVESFLLFNPIDESMLQNKKYYRAQPKVKEEDCVPRQEALSYAKRQEYEFNLLRYISNEFSAIDAKLAKMKKKKSETKSGKSKEKELGKKLSSEATLYTPPGHSSLSHTQLVKNLSMIRDEGHEIRDVPRRKVNVDIYLVAEEKELGEKNRYVADGFLNSTECGLLMELASMTAVEGDGYSEFKSPHSKYERFEGITIGRIALMVYVGQIETERLQQLLEKTEEARSHVERYFGLDRPLYITYTHLVCRTALPGNFHLMHQRASGSFRSCNRVASIYLVRHVDSPTDRNDLSHLVHADNCILMDKGTCIRESPAYVWRDYSAILYLNNDFQGGEFFFAKDRTKRELDNLVFPRCGRMVAFSAGEENLHGVRSVLRGKRCALALWFTQNETHMEYERILAQAILKRVRSVGPLREKGVQVPLRYEDVLFQYASNDELIRHFLGNAS
ncbi:prolyl 3-hydroxylase 1-like isoform X1 [Hylaeus anthracinus]|uniref:prolyl 3-hydroxylase 1-like isoform X1 n=1 Tax=Hylaeus anthracinus TaxID=313031 RepID=UPI0023B9E3BF|nr:prolyl 3-hydroxylase 1-like isoform X1 [Hylaeus anthracinus]